MTLKSQFEQDFVDCSGNQRDRLWRRGRRWYRGVAAATGNRHSKAAAGRLFNLCARAWFNGGRPFAGCGKFGRPELYDRAGGGHRLPAVAKYDGLRRFKREVRRGGQCRGGTATFEQGALNLNVPAFNQADVRGDRSGYANLDWTRVGYWGTGGGWWDYDDVVGRFGAFVTGYETPAAAVPTTGTATYAGLAEGVVFFPGISPGTSHCACNIVTLTGNAAFNANFGTRNVSGSLTGMTAGGAAWNDVAFNSTIAGNAFSGTTSVTSAPGGPASMLANAAGTVEGKFFGPAAQEAGALWTLFDGTNAAVGTITGKRP